MLLINNNKTTTVELIKEFLPTEEREYGNLYTCKHLDWMAYNFNDVFTETGLFEKYQACNFSYQKYKDIQSWSNVMLNDFAYDAVDFINFESWIKLILLNEYGEVA